MKFNKVNKPTARKLYNCGVTIYLLPCKVSEVALQTGGNMWVSPVEISLLTCKHDANKFDRSVNDFEYYNCNAELGYYASYYVTEEDIASHEMCELMCQ